MATKDDFTPTGLKIEGTYENDRNKDSSDLFKAIIREAYGTPSAEKMDVIIGHHLIYEQRDKHADGFTYDVVQEVPSADALIFDHDVAKKIWGAHWSTVLTELALTPVPERDKKLDWFYHNRTPK